MMTLLQELRKIAAITPANEIGTRVNWDDITAGDTSGLFGSGVITLGALMGMFPSWQLPKLIGAPAFVLENVIISKLFSNLSNRYAQNKAGRIGYQKGLENPFVKAGV